MSSRRYFHVGLLCLLVLVSLANFYRNRDPYRAYFHPCTDRYLTTHMIESEFDKDCRELEFRLQRRTTPNFYQAVTELYKGREVVLPDDVLLDGKKLAAVSVAEVAVVRNTAFRLANKEDINSLLSEAVYSFFYSPLSFSSLKRNELLKKRRKRASRCLEYRPPWDETSFPLLMVMLPGHTPKSSSIRVVHAGKYLFFIPSRHPVLVEQQ